MNVKPGDLAIVIYAPHTPELIGRIVRVDRQAVDGEQFGGIRFGSWGFASWVCSADRPLPWRTTTIFGLVHFPKRPIADFMLRPISGLPLEEETDTRIPEAV